MYARVSTTEQVDGTSLTTQTERCRAYIGAQGWALSGEFIDEGVSGAKANRPALERLLDAVRNHDVEAIVVSKLDRLGRSMRHLVGLLGELDDRGVRVVSVAEGFDSQTPAGRLQRNILGSFAEYEREQIRERTTSGLVATARDGFWPGGQPPYGWRLARDGRHTKVELDQDEALVLRMAAEMLVVEGMQWADVARRLNANGHFPRKGGSWNRTSLRWALSGPLAGEWHYAPTAGSRRHPGEGLAVVRGPEIVPSPLRDAIDRILTSAERGQRPEWYPYLLTGRFQSLCGFQYTGAHKTKRGFGYECRRHYRASVYGDEDCQCRRVPVELVEPLVWGGLVEMLSEPGRLDALAEQWLAKTMAPAGVERESLEAVERRIERLEANLTRQVADYLRQGVPGNTVRLATAEVVSEVEQLKAYRAKLATITERRSGASLRSDELLAAARAALDEDDPRRRQRAAELFELRVKLLDWDECPGCYGSGRAHNSGRGARCLVCFGVKGLPVISVTGAVDASVWQPRDGSTQAPVPFSLDLRAAG